MFFKKKLVVSRNSLSVMFAFEHGQFSNKRSPTGMVQGQLRASVDVNAITGPVVGD